MDLATAQRICEAMEGKAINPGGFVSAMGRRDYGAAAFIADSRNARDFCELVKFCEWTREYGLGWGYQHLAGLVSEAAGVTDLQAAERQLDREALEQRI